MSHSKRWACCAVLSLTACIGRIEELPHDDGGSVTDSGVALDGGETTDAGSPATDAGHLDAGSIDAGPFDAGHVDGPFGSGPVGDAGSLITSDAGLVFAWKASAAIGEWARIPNTTVPGEMGDFSGMALRETGIIEIASLANGGHGGNLTDNSVKTLRLDVDAPQWVVRRGPSDATGWLPSGASGPHFRTDNRPAPRHTYWHTWWVPEFNRYLIFGGRFWGQGAYDYWKTDSFNPDLNDWEPPDTYPDSQGFKLITFRNPVTGIFYSTQGSALTTYSPATKTYAGPVNLHGTGTVSRGGNAFDTKRGFIFHLSTGDNFSVGGAINSAKIDPATASTTEITYSDSPGWVDFQAKASTFLGSNLVYDPDLDRYYFYNGGSGQTQKIYVITPNATTTWSMALLPVTGLTPGESGGGVLTKFVYVSALRSVILAVAREDVYFVRMQ